MSLLQEIQQDRARVLEAIVGNAVEAYEEFPDVPEPPAKYFTPGVLKRYHRVDDIVRNSLADFTKAISVERYWLKHYFRSMTQPTPRVADSMDAEFEVFLGLSDNDEIFGLKYSDRLSHRALTLTQTPILLPEVLLDPVDRLVLGPQEALDYLHDPCSKNLMDIDVILQDNNINVPNVMKMLTVAMVNPQIPLLTTP